MVKLMKEDKFTDISLLVLFATFLVVLGHSLPNRFEYSLNDAGGYQDIISGIYVFHMPLFFYISGFLLQKSKSNDGFKQFVKKKIRRLIFPYLIFSTLGYSLKIFLSAFAMRPLSPSILDYVYRLFFPWENPVIFYWFLPTLFLVFILFYFINKISTKSITILPLMMLFLFTFEYFPHQSIPSVFLNYTGVLHNMIFFFLGGVIAVCNFKKLLEITLISCMFSVLIFGNMKFQFIALCILSCHFLCYVIANNFKYSSWLAKKSDLTFFIYLTSFFIQVPLGFIIFSITKQPIYMMFFSCLFGFCVPMLVGQWILSKPNFRKFSKQIGVL
jgi:hypothetical protein